MSSWCARSRNEHGSSSRSVSVACASTSATQTLCRCPPDSSSTRRWASPAVSVMANASATTASSSSPPPHHRRCGWRPRATSSATVSPSGTSGDCGRKATDRACSRALTRARSRPATSIVPDTGRSCRPRARRMVDLPQPLAPIRTVVRPAGMSRSRSRTTGSAPYPSVSPRTRNAGVGPSSREVGPGVSWDVAVSRGRAVSGSVAGNAIR